MLRIWAFLANTVVGLTLLFAIVQTAFDPTAFLAAQPAKEPAALGRLVFTVLMLAFVNLCSAYVIARGDKE